MNLHCGLKIKKVALIMIGMIGISCGLSSSQKRRTTSTSVKLNDSKSSQDTSSTQALKLACLADSDATLMVESRSAIDWMVNKDIDIPVLGRIGVEGCLQQKNTGSIEDATIFLLFEKSTLNSDHTVRDERIVTSFFQSDAKFESRSIVNLSNPGKNSLPVLSEAEEYRIIGDLEISGIGSSVTIDVVVKSIDKGIEVKGDQIKFNLADQLGLSQHKQLLADLSPPTLIDEILNISFRLTLLNPSL